MKKEYRKNQLIIYKMKRILKTCSIVVFTILFCFSMNFTIFAAPENVITEGLNNVYLILASALSSIGMLLTLWGIAEWGSAWMSNDGTMQVNAFKRIGGGLLWVLAPQILPLIVTNP